jgi:hypothetical protein
MPDRSELSGRLGFMAFELILIGVLWYMGFVPHVIAGGLAVVIVVSGLVPERWSSLVSGILMLIGAAIIYFVYTAPGDRRLAAVIAVIGLLFTIYGAVRIRAGR